MRKLCNSCERNLAQKGKNKCRSCTGQGRLPSGKFAYRRHKKEICEKCGFVPVHPVQLSVDHKDGDKGNESLDNFETLCLNCHALKTHLNEDYRNIKYRSNVE